MLLTCHIRCIRFCRHDISTKLVGKKKFYVVEISREKSRAKKKCEKTIFKNFLGENPKEKNAFPDRESGRAFFIFILCENAKI